MTHNFVIFDCDGGSDDAWALLLLLKAEEEQQIRLLGVTISGCGNTSLENAARNLLRILEAAGRQDLPIYFGPAESLVPFVSTVNTPKFHGEDGFGDVLEIDEHLQDIQAVVRKEHAVTEIRNLCLKHHKMVTIIAVGPLTNIALCYSMYGKEFAESVKGVFIMGGNHLGVGNFTSAAEFNFYCDPEAANIVLGKSLCPITILPWEPCMPKSFSISTEWRFEEFGKRAAPFNAAVEILNKVEGVQWTSWGSENWNPCDAMLVAVFLFEEEIVLEQSEWHATVDLGGHLTRGLMVLDHLHEKQPKNVRVIEKIDDTFFKYIAEWATGLKDRPSKQTEACD